MTVSLMPSRGLGVAGHLRRKVDGDSRRAVGDLVDHALRRNAREPVALVLEVRQRVHVVEVLAEEPDLLEHRLRGRARREADLLGFHQVRAGPARDIELGVLALNEDVGARDSRACVVSTRASPVSMPITTSHSAHHRADRARCRCPDFGNQTNSGLRPIASATASAILFSKPDLSRLRIGQLIGGSADAQLRSGRFWSAAFSAAVGVRCEADGEERRDQVAALAARGKDGADFAFHLAHQCKVGHGCSAMC